MSAGRLLGTVTLFVSAAGATRAVAQVTSTLDLGRGAGGTDNTAGTQISTVAPNLNVIEGNFRLHTSAVYSAYESAGWQARGLLTTSWTTPLGRMLQTQVFGTSALSLHHQGTRTGLWEAGIRFIGGATRGGGWVSASRAMAYVGGSHDPFLRLEAGAWNRLGPVRVQIRLRHGVFDDSVLRPTPAYTPTDARRDSLLFTPVLQFTDVALNGGWSNRRLSLDFGAGRRLGANDFQVTSWHAQAAYRVTPMLAIIGAVGRYPPDLPVGLLGGRYATLSLRVDLLQQRLEPDRSREADARGGFAARRLAGPVPDAALLTLRAAGASSVEIMGDFTDWNAIPLEPAGRGWWQAVIRIPPGPRRFNVRFDGGTWQVPAGTTPLADDFGGMVGQFTMP